MTIITVDASPVALQGIKDGKVLSTNSQGFWLQGFVPMEWLYWYHELGYSPSSDILTGPVIIDGSTIDRWETLVRSIFLEEYDEQALVW
jgi:simple sugar transport system substrate-binding protein